ncbi:hypothetical protein VP01_3326g1 [Puccinia sorghi]|uniref:Uncharacterized protein n=1 Tax=Puccinia sorghi TaxID=27349 RepID=A0A0L6UY30_9BASI|nr:hypothetical protein VP01_3326g1 [Puccinia sorghi]
MLYTFTFIYPLIHIHAHSTKKSLRMSVQLNFFLTNACICYHRDIYKEAAHYFGDCFFYLFCSLGEVAASIISLFYLTLFYLVNLKFKGELMNSLSYFHDYLILFPFGKSIIIKFLFPLLNSLCGSLEKRLTLASSWKSVVLICHIHFFLKEKINFLDHSNFLIIHITLIFRNKDIKLLAQIDLPPWGSESILITLLSLSKKRIEHVFILADNLLAAFLASVKVGLCELPLEFLKLGKMVWISLSFAVENSILQGFPVHLPGRKECKTHYTCWCGPYVNQMKLMMVVTWIPCGSGVSHGFYFQYKPFKPPTPKIISRASHSKKKGKKTSKNPTTCSQPNSDPSSSQVINHSQELEKENAKVSVNLKGGIQCLMMSIKYFLNHILARGM